MIEPIVFFRHYEEEKETFFLTQDNYKYGPGFGMTIAAGVCLLVSSILGFVVFFTIVRKMMRLSSGDAKVSEIQIISLAGNAVSLINAVLNKCLLIQCGVFYFLARLFGESVISTLIHTVILRCIDILYLYYIVYLLYFVCCF